MPAVQLSALLPTRTRTGLRCQIWQRGDASRTELPNVTTARSSRDVLKIWNDEQAQHLHPPNRVTQSSQRRAQLNHPDLDPNPPRQNPRRGTTREVVRISHLRRPPISRNRYSVVKHHDSSPLRLLHLSRTPHTPRRNRTTFGPSPSRYLMLDCQQVMPTMPYFRNSTIPDFWILNP